MSESDRRVFNFDVREIDWRAYFETYVQGIRQWILKDDPSTLPQARKTLVRYSIKSELNSITSIMI